MKEIKLLARYFNSTFYNKKRMGDYDVFCFKNHFRGFGHGEMNFERYILALTMEGSVH